jgi:hypothetical protein
LFCRSFELKYISLIQIRAENSAAKKELAAQRRLRIQRTREHWKQQQLRQLPPPPPQLPRLNQSTPMYLTSRINKNIPLQVVSATIATNVAAAAVQAAWRNSLIARKTITAQLFERYLSATSLQKVCVVVMNC